MTNQLLILIRKLKFSAYMTLFTTKLMFSYNNKKYKNLKAISRIAWKAYSQHNTKSQ